MEACGGCNQEETSLQKHCPGMQERKVETQLELQLVSDVKSHRKGFYQYTGGQKQNQGYHGQLADMGRGKSWGTPCLLHFGFYWQNQACCACGRWEVLPTTAEESQSPHLSEVDMYKNVSGPRWDASEYTTRDEA